MLLFVCAGVVPCVVQASLPPWTQQEEEIFYSQLQKEINRSMQKMQDLEVQARHPRALHPSKVRAQLARAATVTEVKVILFKNFYQTPSIQSAVVRRKLLALFKQDFISENDLQSLKDLVADEKRRNQELR